MAEGNASDAGKIAVGAGIGGLAVLLASQRAKAQPNTDNAAILAALAALVETNNAILEAIHAISIPPGGVGGVVPNTSGITSFRMVCPAAATAYQLPDCSIPDDFQLLIKGWPTNAGLIWVGGAQLECININQVWPILPNEQVGYKVSNANAIWVSAVVAGDIVVCTVEQRR